MYMCALLKNFAVAKRIFENCTVYFVWHDTASTCLVPRLLPSFLSHTVQKTGREPGRFDHVRDDVLYVVLCVVLVIELSPTHAILTHCQSRLVDCHRT